MLVVVVCILIDEIVVVNDVVVLFGLLRDFVDFCGVVDVDVEWCMVECGWCIGGYYIGFWMVVCGWVDLFFLFCLIIVGLSVIDVEVYVMMVGCGISGWFFFLEVLGFDCVEWLVVVFCELYFSVLWDFVVVMGVGLL